MTNDVDSRRREIYDALHEQALRDDFLHPLSRQRREERRETLIENRAARQLAWRRSRRRCQDVDISDL